MPANGQENHILNSVAPVGYPWTIYNQNMWPRWEGETWRYQRWISAHLWRSLELFSWRSLAWTLYSVRGKLRHKRGWSGFWRLLTGWTITSALFNPRQECHVGTTSSCKRVSLGLGFISYWGSFFSSQRLDGQSNIGSYNHCWSSAIKNDVIVS